MSTAQPAFAAGPPGAEKRSWRPFGHGPLHGSDLVWAIAFVLPYAAVFVAFAAYPIGLALWMARSPALYADLIEDPLYLPTLANTLLFVALGVNLKMFFALLLSGFFMRRRWWIKALLVIFLVPWFLASVQAFISFHWMLIGEYGFIDSFLREVLDITGPDWFNHRWLAFGSNLTAFIWKWMPFWTIIFLAGRMAIPRDIYDIAEIDGATGSRRFVHVIFPLLAHLYLVCTLLATIWAFGDFATAYFVSNGTPVSTTHLLATLSYRYAFDEAKPALGIAAAISVLPVLIPIMVLLMRKLQTRELQL